MRFVDYRAELADLCNSLHFSKAVEIGTHQGVFADHFLSKFSGHLTCVDCWDVKAPDPHVEFFPHFVAGSPSREFDFQIAQTVLKGKHGSRVDFLRMKSLAAAGLFEDESVDFVYVDGLHTVPQVKNDIMTWYHKVKSGGILAGHDYVTNPSTAPDLVGVAAVVNWFVVENELELFVTTQEEVPSWYFMKV